MSADLRALTAYADQIGRVFADAHQLIPNEFHALLHIMVGETAHTPLTAGHLQQRLGLTHAGITYLVRRMITAGHIRRDADPADRRKVLLRYEPQGLQIAREFFAQLGAANRRALTGFTDQDLITAHWVMNALATSMDHFRRDPSSHPDKPPTSM